MSVTSVGTGKKKKVAIIIVVAVALIAAAVAVFVGTGIVHRQNAENDETGEVNTVTDAVTETSSVNEILLKNYVGYSLTDAQAELTSLGINVDVQTVANTGGCAENTVQSSSPLPDTLVKIGDTVILFVWGGAEVTSTEQQTEAQTQPTSQPTTVASSSATDASAWSMTEVINYAVTAINRTKACTDNLTATHRASLNASVTKCPGGSAIKNVVNRILDSVTKSTDETLNFANGTAVNNAGETVGLLFPKNGDCSILESGVETAAATQEGGIITVNIKLRQETADKNTLPSANYAAFGFGDISSIDLSAINLKSFDTTYSGSTLTLRINTETGLVESADYTIPFDISLAGSVLGVTAEIGVNATQTESWIINR